MMASWAAEITVLLVDDERDNLETYERALRSPLIVRVPGMTAPGRATDGIVESLDLYPTLAELCAIRLPDGLHGTSFAGALRDPAWAGKIAQGEDLQHLGRPHQA